RRLLPKPGEQILKGIAHGLAESKNGLENGAHHEDENERTPHLVQKYVVQAPAPRAGKMLPVIDAVANLAGPFAALPKVLKNREQWRRLRIVSLVQEAVDGIQTRFLRGAHHGDRGSQFRREFEH